MIIFTDKNNFKTNDLLNLFCSVEWCSITDADIISQAINNSTNVITAWNDDVLVGLVRSMDDGCWSSNIDCLVVHKNYQHRGIGTELMKRLLHKIGHIENISVSPSEYVYIGFYERLGFKIVENSRLLQICK